MSNEEPKWTEEAMIRLGDVAITVMMTEPHMGVLTAKLKNARLGADIQGMWTIEEICALEHLCKEVREYCMPKQSLDIGASRRAIAAQKAGAQE